VLGFNWWLTARLGAGLLLTIVLGLILAGVVVGASVGLVNKPDLKGKDFVDALTGSKALKVTFTLIGWMMLVRIWWNSFLPGITANFTSANYWLGVAVASVILALATVILWGFLQKYSTPGHRGQFYAMVCVGLIATILAFTSDRPQGEYFDPDSGDAIAKYCDNEQCPNPDQSRVFLGEVAEDYKMCPYCGKLLKPVVAEQVAKHLKAVQASKSEVFTPVRWVAAKWNGFWEARASRKAARTARSTPRPVQPFVVDSGVVEVTEKYRDICVPQSGDALVYLYEGDDPKIISHLLVQTEGGNEVQLEAKELDQLKFACGTIRRNYGGTHRIRLNPDSGHDSVEIKVILIRHGTSVMDQTGYRGLVSLCVREGVLNPPQGEPETSQRGSERAPRLTLSKA